MKLSLLSVSVWSLTCSPHIRLGFLQFLLTSQKHASKWLGNTESPLGVNVCVHDVLGWIAIPIQDVFLPQAVFSGHAFESEDY